MTTAPTDPPSQSERSPRRFRPSDALGLFLRGLAMGGVDIIPGVSGGTIAFITGIYERFIDGIRSLSPAFLVSLARGRAREARERFFAMHWETLIPIGGGAFLAVLLFSRVIIGMMEDHPGVTYAFFFGLILASSWLPLAHMRRFTWRHALYLALAAAAAWMFVGLRAGPIELRVARHDTNATTLLYPSKVRSAAHVDAVRLTASTLQSGESPLTLVIFDPGDRAGFGEAAAPANMLILRSEAEAARFLESPPPLILVEEVRASLPWILLCGAIAISAMILPGISGSFLLLFLGQYQAVFSTIHLCVGHIAHLLGRAPEPLVAIASHAWYEDFAFLGVFAVGVILGLAIFSRVVSWLFERAHDVTMAVLTGIMIGALRQPGQVVLDSAAGPGYWTLVTVAAFVGAVIVLGLHFADTWMRARRAAAVAA